MTCTKARSLFSPYLDGSVTGHEMHEISDHLRACAGCQSDYGVMENTRSMVANLGRRQPPPDLALKLKVAISNERSWRERGFTGRYLFWLENLCNAFMVPATAGILGAVVFFGVLIGLLVPAQVRAQNDIPTPFYTPPRLEMSAMPDSQLELDSSVVVETYVDATGRVENYRIISGDDDDRIHEQLNRALLFTTFAPAQSFGRPVPGKAVISFSRVNVKG